MSKLNQVFCRIYFETASAIHPGSGESDLLFDMPVQYDMNSLPCIQGTSICGVLRNLYEKTYNTNAVNELFGSQNNKENRGSRIIVSDAFVLDAQGEAVEELLEEISDPYLEQLTHLPVRDHCSISVFGTAEKASKFDRTVLFPGIRFVMEFQISGESLEYCDKEADKLLALFEHPLFRLGGGTRSGFGKIKVLAISKDLYDLSKAEGLEKYLQRSSSLAKIPDNLNYDFKQDQEEFISSENYKTWSITLTPESTWLFSSGVGEGDMDIFPKYEDRIIWEDKKIGSKSSFESFLIIPATSVKGALAHRTAYHYNRLIDRYADELDADAIKAPCPAVSALFGSAADSKQKGLDSSTDSSQGHCGKVMIDDLYCSVNASQYKVFNHVAIDRFTGGALDGMLFDELAVYSGEFQLNITLDKSEIDQEALSAFEKAVDDLVNGRLPLGGGVMRGHGIMSAKSN